MTDPTQAERDEVLGDVVAALRALHSGDIAGAQHVIEHADAECMVGLLLRMLDDLGTAAVGADYWDAVLARWRPGTQLGAVE